MRFEKPLDDTHYSRVDITFVMHGTKPCIEMHFSIRDAQHHECTKDFPGSLSFKYGAMAALRKARFSEAAADRGDYISTLAHPEFHHRNKLEQAAGQALEGAGYTSAVVMETEVESILSHFIDDPARLAQAAEALDQILNPKSKQPDLPR